MRLNSKKFIGLHVKTRAGTSLGKVASFDVDCETGRLATIQVKTRGLVPGLMDQELVITWEQIIECTEKELIVQDAVVPAGSRAIAMATESATGNVQLSKRASSIGGGVADA